MSAVGPHVCDEWCICPAGHPLRYHRPSQTHACTVPDCLAYERVIRRIEEREARMAHEVGCPVRTGPLDVLCRCRIIRGEDQVWGPEQRRRAREEEIPR